MIDGYWRDDAVCDLSDAAALSTDHKPRREEYERLARKCAVCPVIRNCAQTGLANRFSGFYAGVYLPQVGSERREALEALRSKAGAA